MESAVAKVLAGGVLVLGPWVESFEADFAAFLGRGGPEPYVVGVASGSDALVLALQVLDLPPGSGVLVPANDGGFAGWAARAAGLRPVAMDVDVDTQLVTPATAEDSMVSDVSAIVVTHLHGNVAELDDLDRWRRGRGLRLVEDCAQAHGAESAGRHVGMWGDASAFSFYPTKNLGAMGDAGAVVLHGPADADRVRDLRTYGWGERFRIEHPGGRNSRLDAVHAAVLSARLPFLAENIARRRGILEAYRATAKVDFLTPTPGGVAHHAVVMERQRDALAAHLDAGGVSSTVHYPWLVTEMPGLQIDAARSLPVASVARERKLSVPCFPDMTSGEVETVAASLADWWTRTEGADHA